MLPIEEQPELLADIERDEPPESSRFFTGLLYGLAISCVVWVLLIVSLVVAL